MSSVAGSEFEPGGNQPSVPFHSHGERFGGAGGLVSDRRNRTSCRRPHRAPARWPTPSFAGNCGSVSGVGGRLEEMPPPAVGKRAGLPYYGGIAARALGG